MGFLKDLNKWLSGGKSKTDNVRQASIKLKVFNKRLMRQVNKLEMTAKLARDKVIRFRQQGDLEASKFHARNYLQVKKQARAIDAFRTNLEGLQFKLDQAATVSDVAGIMKNISQSVSQLKSTLSIPQITELMSSINMDIEDFAVTQEIASEHMDNITLDTAVTDSDVSEVLGEIDAEIGFTAATELPNVASGEKINELEKELDRLKSKD